MVEIEDRRDTLWVDFLKQAYMESRKRKSQMG